MSKLLTGSLSRHLFSAHRAGVNVSVHLSFPGACAWTPSSSSPTRTLTGSWASTSSSTASNQASTRQRRVSREEGKVDFAVSQIRLLTWITGGGRRLAWLIEPLAATFFEVYMPFNPTHFKSLLATWNAKMLLERTLKIIYLDRHVAAQGSIRKLKGRLSTCEKIKVQYYCEVCFF